MSTTNVNFTIDDFTGDAGSGGTHGLVPAPDAGDAAAGKVLNADGTWDNVDADDITATDFFTAKSGAVTAVYKEAGTSAGKPFYQKVGGTIDDIVVWITGPDRWRYLEAGIEVYHSDDDVANPTLVTTWIQDAGGLPLPTVSQLYTGTAQEIMELLALADLDAGAVTSVNGATGVVVLDAADVGADPAGSAAAAQAFAIQRANHTGTQLAATISDFAATVRSTVLTGLSLATSTAITAADSVLAAFGKLQAQITSLASNGRAVAIRTYTGTTDTLVLADAGNMVRGNNAGGNTCTIPPNASVAFPTGTQILFSQRGAGQMTIAAGAGVTINSYGAALKLVGQYAQAIATKVDTNEWSIDGNLTT